MLGGLLQGELGPRKKLKTIARLHALGQIESPEREREERSEVDNAAAVFGLRPEYEVEVVEPLYLWPENVDTWLLYQALQTSWEEDPWGEPAIQAFNVDAAMRMHGVARRDQKGKFQEVQAMQRAARSAWREMRGNG